MPHDKAEQGLWLEPIKALASITRHDRAVAPNRNRSFAVVVVTNNILCPELNEKTLPNVQMPNRDGFVPDPHPDVPVKAKQR